VLGPPPSEVALAQTPKAKKQDAAGAGADGETPEKGVETRPLLDLLGPAGEGEAATEKDRLLLPKVITTFSRRLGEQKNDRQRQTTRDAYVLATFKLFSQSGRSLQAMAAPRFAELAAHSEEARKNRVLLTALRTFQRFWEEVGGYEGVFDEADRESMNLALNVRPCLVDAAGECGALGHAGRACARPNQECQTCGTFRLRCSTHCEHSPQECREIFWSKHSSKGTKLRTVANWFRLASSPSTPASAASAAPDAAAAPAAADGKP